MDTTLITLAERPELAAALGPLHHQFPPFILEGDPVNRHYWSEVGLYAHFPEFQFALCDKQGTVLACGHTLPLDWNGRVEALPSGYDGALEQGFADRASEKPPTTLCALAAVTAAPYQGMGLSHRLIAAMMALARRRQLSSLIVPVRPTRKSGYPLTPMEKYILWKREDGSPFDPWLRVHIRLGGTILKVADASVAISGTVADWERWSGMAFPESGSYVVSGALSPVAINREGDQGVYLEPNVWVCHRISQEPDTAFDAPRPR